MDSLKKVQPRKFPGWTLLFDPYSVSSDRVAVLLQLGGDEKELLTARHGFKFLRAEVMPLPENVSPVCDTPGLRNQFFAASSSSPSSILEERPSTFITMRETCWYSSAFGKTLSGISVMSTQL